MKRLTDLFFSFIALLVFAGPAIIIALILVLKERHPVFFKQERIGRNKKVFKIWKFQTMVNQVPTPTGRILRRTGLDELPQFINVFKGDMSIVGPRALTKADIQRLGWDGPFHNRRWSLKPGITGYAQLYGGQHRKTSWFWDKQYIRSQSFLIDALVITCSFGMNLFGKTRVRQFIFQKNNLK